MRMTDEQFINEVYRRRDGELKKRRVRRKTILSVVPLVVVVTLATAVFSLRGLDKSAELADGSAQNNAAPEESAVYYNSDNSKVNLDDKGFDWLLNNAVLDEEEDDIGSVGDEDCVAITDNKGDTDKSTTGTSKGETTAGSGPNNYSGSLSSQLKNDDAWEPEGTVIELSLGSEIHRFVLNSKGLYSCEEKMYLPITQEKLDVLRGFIK